MLNGVSYIYYIFLFSILPVSFFFSLNLYRSDPRNWINLHYREATPLHHFRPLRAPKGQCDLGISNHTVVVRGCRFPRWAPHANASSSQELHRKWYGSERATYLGSIEKIYTDGIELIDEPYLCIYILYNLQYLLIWRGAIPLLGVYILYTNKPRPPQSQCQVSLVYIYDVIASNQR